MTDLLKFVEALYLEQVEKHSSSHSLVEGGSQLWLNSFLPTLGKFCHIFTAKPEISSPIVGFISVRIKAYPKYLNIAPRGLICELYVRPEFRGKGVGNMLVQQAQKWLLEKEISCIELNSVARNSVGEAFWKNCGFVLELQQWAKTL